MTEKDWLLLEAIDRVGIRGSAKRDAFRRGVERFGETGFDAIEAHDFYHRDLRSAAPHLWQPETPVSSSTRGVPTPASTAAAGPDKPRRPQPVALTPSQQAEAMELPPAQRLTYYRERQKEAAERR